jgi:hypothetical protein
LIGLSCETNKRKVPSKRRLEEVKTSLEMLDLLLSLNTTNQFKKTKNKVEEIKRKKRGKEQKRPNQIK